MTTAAAGTRLAKTLVVFGVTLAYLVWVELRTRGC